MLRVDNISVSIHPPRVGRDSRRVRPHPDGSSISIHPPRVGRDTKTPAGRREIPIFQSTLPVWGGTTPQIINQKSPLFQSTLPVWGGTCQFSLSIVWTLFQSTLPVWGGTPTHDSHALGYAEFQSTLPVWGGTFGSQSPVCVEIISIHPPRVGRDNFPARGAAEHTNFNPPSPCGEGPCGNIQKYLDDGFQSTLPVRGGTYNCSRLYQN